MSTRRAIRTGMALALAACALGCSDAGTGGVPLAQADRAQFDAVIYPILLRDCAFSGCHGEDGRFFHVYGPGRSRRDPMMEPYAPATAEELTLAYERTIAMIDPSGRAEASLLLSKPLDREAGGAGHEGVDRWGRDVYLSAQDPSYVQLKAWALGAAGGAR